MTAAPTLTHEEELHWLALRLVSGLGMRKAALLLERYRTPQAIFRASRSELEGHGLSGGVAQSIASGCTFDEAVDQHQKALASGAAIVPLADPRYPALLREIFDPPVLLFARGNTALLDSLQIAVVGTRRATPYGAAVSERLSFDLAQAGLTITSGMARGIDTAAHRGALEAGGNTIAVLGCGVDVIYPAENRPLATTIAERGLLVSEFPMGAPGYPQNFPIRNRIISGLSLGVLVVEGAQYSGSAITARLAMEQQREVFAVPGSIMSKLSWGPNLLIKDGAKLVQDWNDVVVELPVEARQRLAALARERQPQGSLATESGSAGQPEISPVSAKLLKTISPDTPAHLDELLASFDGYSSSETIAALFELEMLGLVRQLPGKNFVKVW